MLQTVCFDECYVLLARCCYLLIGLCTQLCAAGNHALHAALPAIINIGSIRTKIIGQPVFVVKGKLTRASYPRSPRIASTSIEASNYHDNDKRLLRCKYCSAFNSSFLSFFA
jgi:hypothetical protein